MADRERPEIGYPQDFEHFLHVGADDIGSGALERDQNSTFLETVERRRRRLPRTPKRDAPSDARSVSVCVFFL